MSAFEYFFTLYGLLLGLALTNVATGFADMARGHENPKIGILVPLLALVTISFVMGQWYVVFLGQTHYSVTPSQLIMTLTMTLPFTFISSAMFPRDLERWETLDAYFIAKRRTLLGGVVASSAVAIISNALIFAYWEPVETSARTVTMVLLPLLAMRSEKRWVHAGVLILCSAFYCVFRVFTLI